MDEVDEALKRLEDLKKSIPKPAPSIFHQGSRMLVGSLAGFATEKLVEHIYTRLVINRKKT